MFEDTEFGLPDEDRLFSLRKVKRCPVCKSVAHLPCIDRRLDIETNKQVYRVRCGDFQCGHSTPELPTSQDAIRHWQLSAILGE